MRLIMKREINEMAHYHSLTSICLIFAIIGHKEYLTNLYIKNKYIYTQKR